MNWNIRYIYYAMAHGKTPEAMLENDKIRFPGACMVEYILWIRESVIEFEKKFPELCMDGNIIDHNMFDNFLKEKSNLIKNEYD